MKILLSALNRRRFDAVAVFGFVLILAAAFIGLSQGPLAHGDEGFHLLAATLVNAGKRPYLDFFYQHVPLFMYVNAAWMWIFGTAWRSAHVLSALLTVVCAFMISAFFYNRIDERFWRVTCAVLAPLFLLGNVLEIHWAVLAEPFAWCVTFAFAAYLLSLRFMRTPGASAVWVGLTAAAASAGSLLAVPITTVLFVWVVGETSKSDRLRVGGEFLAGSAIAFAPLGVLALLGPRQVLFDLVGYHLTARHTAPLKPGQDLVSTLTGWTHSAQGVSLVILGLIGLAFVVSNKEHLPRLQTELRLAAFILLGITLWLCLIRPTFRQYFVLTTPFLIVLACVGLYAIGTRVCTGWHAIWFIAAVVGLFCHEAKNTVREQLTMPEQSWRDIEQVADFVNRVVPHDRPFYTPDAAIYLASKRFPLPGLENNYSFYLRPLPEFKKLLHVVPQPDINAMISKGYFAGVAAWGPRQAEELHLATLYRNHQEFRGHIVFWNWADGPGGSVTPASAAQR